MNNPIDRPALWTRSPGRVLLAGLVIAAAATAAPSQTCPDIASYLGERGMGPVEYVLSRAASHRVTIVGEARIWTGPLESFRLTTIIPLAEYAPDAAALAEVAHSNPFTDDVNVSPAKLAEIWARQIADNGDILAKRGWNHLAAWRSFCK